MSRKLGSELMPFGVIGRQADADDNALATRCLTSCSPARNDPRATRRIP